MATLYRKYRPSKFAEILGQNHIKTTLQHEIESNQLAHAYLFCGPRAVGKTTIARILSKSINCVNRKSNEHEPCNNCSSCKEISESRGVDVIEIDAASYTGVDNVRDNIIASSRVSPSSSKHKIFIIDEVHMLSIAAFNALLKTLEEPPRNVTFILCTTESHKIPTTIISRCQRFDFKRIDLSDIINKLSYISREEGVEVEKSVLETIAQQSDGHMRDAESIFGQLVSISGNKITENEANLVVPKSNLSQVLDLVDLLSKKDTGNSIRKINNLLEDGIDLSRFAEELIEAIRKIMFLTIDSNLADKFTKNPGSESESIFIELSKKFLLANLIQLSELFIQAKKELKLSFIKQLPLEIAIIKFTSNYSAIDATTARASGVKNTGVKAINREHEAKTKTTTAQNPSAINIDSIHSQWAKFLSSIREKNHSLSFIMEVCEPRGVDGNIITLAFKYKFHKDRLNEVKIKSLVEEILFKIYGKKLEINIILDENLKTKQTEKKEIVIDNNSLKKEDLSKKNKKEIEQSSEDKEESNNPPKDAMQNLLSAFGGKVVG